MLRILCARGDLWLDEIWSLQNLAAIRHADEIFYAISQDNNHFLNSLWLFLVGPQAPPPIIRLEAILAGTLTIPAAAKLAGRAGNAAALAAAALAAFGFVFVHYGSEARGYAGFLLMLFLAADALEDVLADSRALNPRVWFALDVGIGALFHVAMIEAAAVLVAATLARSAMRTHSFGATMRLAWDLGVAAFLAVLPTVAAIAAGAIYTHKIQFGVQVPYSFSGFVQGFDTLFGATLGFTVGSWPPMAFGAVVLWTGLALAIVPPEKRTLPIFTIALPPLAAALIRLPNVHIPRFHLIAVLGFVLLFAEVTAHFWKARKPAFTFAVIFATLAGNAAQVWELLKRGRGHSSALVAAMEADGGGTYGANMEAEVTRTIRFYDEELGGHLVPADERDWCSAPPRWYILADDPQNETETHTFGPPHCTAAFASVEVVIPAPLSGLRLALYRRSSPSR